MTVERDYSISKENCQYSHIPLIALEGVGGSGKSHVGDLVKGSIEKQGFLVLSAKISGLGDSPRVARLREINDYREKLIQDGLATDKILRDKRRDKIFRLATRHQIQLLLSDLQHTEANIGILDRTPIMPWVYASALDSENPHLGEILDDGIKQTDTLGISTLYYLEVKPETAYSRIIARACMIDSDPNKKAMQMCRQIGADRETSEKIVENAMELITNNPGLRPKDYRGWDFIPYAVMAKECEKYTEVLEELQSLHGIRCVPVDAERPVNQVTNSIMVDIKTSGLLQNI